MSQEWDVLTAESIGGGGYGDVLERAPEMVIKDLRDGLISDWTAQNIYCVVYDSKTLEVDFEGTIELRQRRRQDRLQRGRKWADFEREWLQKKPPEDALELFGSWPDGKPLRPIIRM
jgi:acetophenone carboxylase